jgi:hypothetical protein
MQQPYGKIYQQAIQRGGNIFPEKLHGKRVKTKVVI